MVSYFVEITKFPEEDQKLLVKLDLLGGVGQVGLSQRVSEQASQAFQDKVIILKANVFLNNVISGRTLFFYIAMVRYKPPPCEFWKGSSRTGFVVRHTVKEKKRFKFSSIDHLFF